MQSWSICPAIAPLANSTRTVLSVEGIKRPTDLIRHLKDAFAKSESKLTNFPSPRLTGVRCYCKALTRKFADTGSPRKKKTKIGGLWKSLTYYEEQLRLCDLPGSARTSDVSVTTVGRRDTRRSSAKRDERVVVGGLRKSKSDCKKKGKGRGDQTPKGARLAHLVVLRRAKATTERGEKGKEKGKDKWKKRSKKPKKHKKGKDKGRSLTESESEEESGEGATLMALRFFLPLVVVDQVRLSEVSVLSDSETPSSVVARNPVGLGPKGPTNLEDLASESMGATCHIASTQHLSGFRVVKKHERSANLFNASGGPIVVSGVVDLKVHFGDFPEVGRGFGCRGGFQCDFSLDGFRARLEDLPCERWVEVAQGEQEEHQACGCSAGLVGSEREQEKSQTPAERRGSYGD